MAPALDVNLKGMDSFIKKARLDNLKFMTAYIVMVTASYWGLTHYFECSQKASEAEKHRCKMISAIASPIIAYFITMFSMGK